MHNLGVLALFAFVALNSTASVEIGSLLQELSPWSLLATCFALLSLGFAAANLRGVGRGRARELFRTSAPELGVLNLSAAAGWAGFFFALQAIEPAVVTSVTSGVGTLLTPWLVGGDPGRPGSLRKAAGAGIALAVAALVYGTFNGLSARGEISADQALTGLACAALCGVANVVNSRFGKRVSARGFAAREWLPLRFFLLIAVALWLAPAGECLRLISPPWTLTILLLTAFGLAAPTLCYQLGVQHTQPFTAAAVHSMIPVFVLAAQLFDSRLSVSPMSIFGAVAITVSSVVYQVARERDKRVPA